MAAMRARGRGAAGFVAGPAVGGALVPRPGFGGGGGAGRAGGGLVAAAGFGGADFAAGATVFALAALAAGRAAGAAGLSDAPGLAAAAGAALPGAGPAVAPSGVPQRAQNLNVAAFKVMQLGHCLGGAPEACSRGAGLGGDDFAITVGADSCSGSWAPQERQEPTSVSFQAPHFGQSMSGIVVLGREQGQGAPRPQGPRFSEVFRNWNKPRTCANLPLPRGASLAPQGERCRSPAHAASARFRPERRGCACTAALPSSAGPPIQGSGRRRRSRAIPWSARPSVAASRSRR